ncbi:unnamed protein product [Rhizophagus irregularis]|uniref:NADAR domain-containing protein n=1 Tax=Rhizophagus irregularis TaxID=588596 RepID=A0A2I1ERI7_9GLOM|nr:DUF1768-domain-containing protein [Rhizophagus irregularis]PKY29743.1 DUF1768-domain-containing protein [Rhizophagus irregularis]CAB5322169.1 unnamed protein product [Rhizophagus irregularis]
MEKSVIKFYGVGNEWGEFSNFFKAEILIDGETWPTTEHYFQAQKFPSQPEIQQKIRNFEEPGQAAKFSRKHSGLRSDWEQIKDGVMRDAEIVEASPTDSYWGNATRSDGSEGFNKLGRLLMEIREKLANEQQE